MLANIGITGWLVIIVIALLVFGPSKLPELGRSVGKTLREFKNGTKEMLSEDEPERKELISTNQTNKHEL